jgi:hypothetical protein
MRTQNVTVSEAVEQYLPENSTASYSKYLSKDRISTSVYYHLGQSNPSLTN